MFGRKKNSDQNRAQQFPPTSDVGDLGAESDANDRVRHWDLPIGPGRRESSDLFVSLVSLGILAAAAYAGWHLRDLEPDKTVVQPQRPPANRVTVEPKVVSALPGAEVQRDANSNRPLLPPGQVVGKLSAPPEEGKWSLSEFPTGGERIELDASGIYARAKNFTEACIGRPDASIPLKVAARARENPTNVRFYLSSGEICATIFDEPLFEFAVENSFRAVQFGLQQGSPFVAMKQIKSPTVALSDVSKAP
jgi:hypothetical protein